MSEEGNDEEAEEPTLQKPVPMQPLFEDATVNVDTEQSLESFRATWRAELRAKHAQREETPSIHDDKENAAKELFLEGVELEKSGQMSEAVSRYKRACKLVPDIERRVYTDAQRKQNRQRSRSRAPVSIPDEKERPLRDVLAEKVVRALSQERSAESIYNLPMEILTQILRCVVDMKEGSDARTIDGLALASSVFYIACRDEELWRFVCSNVWGEDGAHAIYEENEDLSWRNLYITGPRPLVHGIYVAKTTYIRHGESSFQDSNYRPWYTVVYYRLLRFFTDGVVLQCVTTEHPQGMVDALCYPEPPRQAGILKGRYWIDAEKGEIRIQAFRTKTPPTANRTVRRGKRFTHVIPHEVVRQEFRQRLCFDAFRGANWNRHLLWASNVCEVEYASGEVITTELYVPAEAHHSYPPLRFHRAKSYTPFVDCETESPTSE